MNKENENQAMGEQAPVIDKSRRKMTMTGLAVPVILSVSSRPVWAAPANCSFIQALSGNISINGPNPHCVQDRASSVSPGWYKNHQESWELMCGSPLVYTPNDSFNTIFGVPDLAIASTQSGKTGTKTTITNSNPTLGQCLDQIASVVDRDHPTVSLHNQCFHYIAALLSASSSVLIFPYAAQTIIDDWGNFALYSRLQNIQAGEYTVGTVAPRIL